MKARVHCDLCDRLIPPHAHYMVRIDVFADPEMPPASSEEMEEADYQAAIGGADAVRQLPVPIY